MSEIVNWKGVRYYADTGAIENLTAENDKLRARLARLEEALDPGFEVEALAVRCKRLEEALRKIAEHRDCTCADCFCEGIARAALAEEGK